MLKQDYINQRNTELDRRIYYIIVSHKIGDRSEKSLKEFLRDIPKEILDNCISYTNKWKAYNILLDNNTK